MVGFFGSQAPVFGSVLALKGLLAIISSPGLIQGRSDAEKECTGNTIWVILERRINSESA